MSVLSNHCLIRFGWTIFGSFTYVLSLPPTMSLEFLINQLFMTEALAASSLENSQMLFINGRAKIFIFLETCIFLTEWLSLQNNLPLKRTEVYGCLWLWQFGSICWAHNDTQTNWNASVGLHATGKHFQSPLHSKVVKQSCSLVAE